MGKKNVYLSLDDLHKLYGLSNTIINAIKKKRKKRRNKKLKSKINNDNMGGKPSPSDHMIGSSSALAVATQQLNSATINKRIEDINRNNLMLENKKEDIPLEVKIYNKLKNKEVLTPDELQAYEEIQNVMLPKEQVKQKRSYIRGRKTFPIVESNSLAKLSQSNVMGRQESFNNIKISEDDSAGSNVAGTSSDQFINNEVEELMMAPAVDESVIDPSSLVAEQSAPLDEPILNQSTPVYKSIDSYNKKELLSIARENQIVTKKNINKEDLYNLLLDSELITME